MLLRHPRLGDAQLDSSWHCDNISGTSINHEKTYRSIQIQISGERKHSLPKEYHQYTYAWSRSLGTDEGNRIGRPQSPEQRHQCFSSLRAPTISNYVSLWERRNMRRNSLSGRDLVATSLELCAHRHFLPLFHHIVLFKYVRFQAVTKCDREPFT